MSKGPTSLRSALDTRTIGEICCYEIERFKVETKPAIDLPDLVQDYVKRKCPQVVMAYFPDVRHVAEDIVRDKTSCETLIGRLNHKVAMGMACARFDDVVENPSQGDVSLDMMFCDDSRCFCVKQKSSPRWGNHDQHKFLKNM